MIHALVSIPLMIVIGVLFVSAVGPLGWLGASLVVVALWYGRERRDAERHFALDPFAWRDPSWWRLLWPGCWYADARADFLWPAVASTLAGLALTLAHAAL